MRGDFRDFAKAGGWRTPGREPSMRDRRKPRPPIEQVDASSLDEVVAVHCDAFRDYPTMRFLLGADRTDYAESLKTLIGLFVEAIHLKGGVVLGARENGELVAAADTARQGVAEPPELTRRRRSVWERLGEPARLRYESYQAATQTFVPAAPAFYLSMLGVRRRCAGRGLARPLVERVQELSRIDPDSTGVFLETEDPRNVDFYRHLGFRLTGHVAVADGLETWGFFRPD